MKISAKQYAAALYGAVNGKDRSEAGKAVAELARVLKDNRDLKKADDIVFEFGKIWNKEHGIAELSVVTADSLSEAAEKHLKASIKEVSGAGTVHLDKSEDKNILGGVVFKYGDVILDASLRTRLEKLKEEMKK
jgi:F-type H+-transporting ATPase subunit delta